MVGKHNKDHKNYIRQVILSMEKYDSFIKPDNTIIIGDFNSNLKWEKPYRHIDNDHKYVVEELQKKGIESSYHYHFKEEQGDETRPTFFYHHKQEKPFHLDFCFLSKNLIERLNKLEVGKYEDWIKYSDHVPIIIEIQ
jgi:endonuclease/exonuclease/phosphatase family metal-dependent hydrolase